MIINLLLSGGFYASFILIYADGSWEKKNHDPHFRLNLKTDH